MTDNNLKELEKNYIDANKKENEALSKFEKKLLSLDGVNLPYGFGFKVQINGDINFNSEKRNSINITIEDRNKKEGEGRSKYFWTTDHNYVELKFFKGELNSYDSRILHGGYNSTEYANDSMPKIDLITIHEMLMDINGAHLNIMKLAKSNPEIFIENLQEYLLANKKHEELRDIYLDAKRKNDEEKLNLDIAEIKSAFPKISEEKVDELAKTLINSGKYEESVSIMILKTPSSGYDSDVKFKELIVKCKHGDKMTFSASIDGGEGQKRIKASELKKILSSAITVNGAFVSSVSEFKEAVNRQVLNNIIEDLNRNYTNTKYSLPVPIETMTEIATDLKRDNNQELSPLPNKCENTSKPKAKKSALRR